MVGTTKTKETATVLPKPLDDITVLDMTIALAGPFATFLLAGLGARIIKVENPSARDTCRENAPYLGAEGASLVRRSAEDVSVSAINRLRNKLGITLNLKHPEARSVIAGRLPPTLSRSPGRLRLVPNLIGMGAGFAFCDLRSAGLARIIHEASMPPRYKPS